MLQTVDGRDNVFVVDFDTLPELPITWSNDEEAPYALALGDAIQTKKIVEPGKYGIIIDCNDDDLGLIYSLFAIIE